MTLECIVCGTMFRPVDPRLALGIPPDAPVLGVCDSCGSADPRGLRDQAPVMVERLRRAGIERDVSEVVEALGIMSSLKDLELPGGGSREDRN